MPLIINADDFGKDHDTTMAICEAFEKGLIMRTTLMANCEGAKEAMTLAKEKGFADKVGVHLNLTHGHPLTDSMSANLLMCDKNGHFTADFHRNTFKRFVLDKKTRNDITKELDAQIRRYEELGGTLFHLDSHHHVHTDMSVLSAIMPLVRKYNIKSMRLGRNLYHGGNPLMRLYKKMLNGKIGAINKDTCNYFGSVEDFEKYGVSESFRNENVIEIMVHPMYIDGVLSDTDYPLSDMISRLGGKI